MSLCITASSHCAMMQPFTIMASEVDCRSFVAWDLNQAFGCSHLSSLTLVPLVLFSLPLSIIFISILFQRVPANPLPAIFLSPSKINFIVVYIHWYLNIIDRRFGFIYIPQAKLIKTKLPKWFQCRVGEVWKQWDVVCSYAHFTDATSEMFWPN